MIGCRSEVERRENKKEGGWGGETRQDKKRKRLGEGRETIGGTTKGKSKGRKMKGKEEKRRLENKEVRYSTLILLLRSLQQPQCCLGRLC